MTLLICLVSAFFGGCAAAERAVSPEPAATLSPEQRRQNLDSFDYVWTTIRDKYWDPEFGGLDWPAVRDELRPKVADATTQHAARAVMREMVNRLGVSHFAIIPRELYAQMETPQGTGPRDGETGIDVRVIDGQALVTSVAADSPAAAAGVRPGWIVTRIGDDELASRLEAVAREFEDRSYRDYLLASVVKGRLEGPVGQTLTVKFLDGNDQPVSRELTLVEKRGRRVRLGHLPPVHVWIDVRRLDQTVGYIAFNAFLDPPGLMPVFNEAMQSFMDAEGLIIDLRGNGGGLGAMVVGMIGWLVPEKNRELGTVYLRNNRLRLVVFPRPQTYAGPVAVLVDGLSASAAEFFAGGLKDLGRACIVGSRTAGAALPSMIEKLPNGDGFQYVFANYVSAGGAALEGVGVIPDIEVVPSRAELLAGKDPVLEAALAWIRRAQKAEQSQVSAHAARRDRAPGLSQTASNLVRR